MEIENVYARQYCRKGDNEIQENQQQLCSSLYSGKLNEWLLFCLSLYTTLFFLSCKFIQFRIKMTHINYELVLNTFALMSNQPEIIEMR